MTVESNKYRYFLLLNAGADIDISSSDGWTPLFVATSHGFLDMAKFLLKMGADFYIEDNVGRPFFHPLFIEEHKEVVDFVWERLSLLEKVQYMRKRRRLVKQVGP